MKIPLSYRCIALSMMRKGLELCVKCVHVCVSAVEKYERKRKEGKRERNQVKMNVCLVSFGLCRKKPESKCADVICKGLSVGG